MTRVSPVARVSHCSAIWVALYAKSHSRAVNLLVQLMLVHGEKVEDNRWRVTVNGTRGGKVRGDSAGAT
jgi:hypothetical protein